MTLQEAERYVDQKLERLKTALEQEPLGKESKLRLRHELFMLEGAVGVLRDSLTRPVA